MNRAKETRTYDQPFQYYGQFVNNIQPWLKSVE